MWEATVTKNNLEIIILKKYRRSYPWENWIGKIVEHEDELDSNNEYDSLVCPMNEIKMLNFCGF